MSEFVEVCGRIKWFDAGKGFGFITDDATDADVMVHVTTLRAAGYSNAHAGATVRCEALRRPKGLTVCRIIDMDDSTAKHDPYYDNSPAPVEATSEWTACFVKWFNRVRGFGFLVIGPGYDDVFVHMETLRRCSFTELRPGQVIDCRYGDGPRGLVATDLRPSAPTWSLP